MIKLFLNRFKTHQTHDKDPMTPLNAEFIEMDLFQFNQIEKFKLLWSSPKILLTSQQWRSESGFEKEAIPSSDPFHSTMKFNFSSSFQLISHSSGYSITCTEETINTVSATEEVLLGDIPESQRARRIRNRDQKFFGMDLYLFSARARFEYTLLPHPPFNLGSKINRKKSNIFFFLAW